jgi:Helix-turn-helix domain
MEERIQMGQRERDRLKVMHAVEEGHLKQREGGERLRLSTRQVRRLQARVRAEGDRGIVHRLRGRPSNRKIPTAIAERILRRVEQSYRDFGPTLAAEKLALQGLRVSRETLRQRMIEAGLWKPRRQRVKHVHVWRERRAAFGELVMMDSSPYRWLEERGPELQLIAMIDDATSRIWGRFAEHDSTEENFRTLEGWLRRQGRPVSLYTDKNSLFVTSRPARIEEQTEGREARTQFGRALHELDIEWIAAHSPQAKGRIENLFGTLQDRLVKEMRLAEVKTIQEANRFFEEVFIPFWEDRFAVAPRQAHDAHRRLGREHRLEQILSVREPRQVAQDYTLRWQGQLWAIPRAEVRAGLRGARVEVERRLDGSLWARFRGSYLSLKPCALAARRSASPSGLRPPGLADPSKNKTKTKYIPPPDHPWRTFLFGRKPDISTLR